jgi:hypothetical protein
VFLCDVNVRSSMFSCRNLPVSFREEFRAP